MLNTPFAQEQLNKSEVVDETSPLHLGETIALGGGDFTLSPPQDFRIEMKAALFVNVDDISQENAPTTPVLLQENGYEWTPVWTRKMY